MLVGSIMCYLLSFCLLVAALKMTDDLIDISHAIIHSSQKDAERTAFLWISVKRFGLFGRLGVAGGVYALYNRDLLVFLR